MMRTMIWATMASALVACNEGPAPGWGSSGDTVWVTCKPASDVTYDHGCEAPGDPSGCSRWDELCLPQSSSRMAGAIAFCEPVEKGDLDPENVGLFAESLESECTSRCPGEVRDQACGLGRYAENISGCAEMGVSWVVEDCSTEEAFEQRLDLTYKPLVGRDIRASGTLGYTVEASRTGGSVTLWSLSLDSPLVLTGAVRDATALMGYPEGTRVEVHRTSLAGPVTLPLDASGRATLRQGTADLDVEVSLTEPGASPRRTTLHAGVPLSLDLVVASGRLSIDDVRGPFGGRFLFSGTSAP